MAELQMFKSNKVNVHILYTIFRDMIVIKLIECNSYKQY